MQDDPQTARSVNDEAIALLRVLGQKQELAYALMGLAIAAADAGISASAATEAKALLQENGEMWMLGLMEFILADVAQQRGDYAAARIGHTESLRLFREIGDLHWSTSPLISLGRIACAEGNYVRARALVEEALAIRRQNDFDNHWSLAIALNSLGEVDRCEANAIGAAPLFEEALSYGRVLGDEPIISWSLHNLGHVALQANELSTAAARFNESLVIRLRSGPGANLAAGLAGVAGIAARNRAFSEAAWLFGAVDAMLETTRMVLAPADELVRRADLATVRGRLDPEAIAAALNGGRAAAPEDVERAAQGIRAATMGGTNQL
jgi:tetratricopeptide (TPR) repeat protein